MVSVLFGINEEYFCENEFAERRRVKMSGACRRWKIDSLSFSVARIGLDRDRLLQISFFNGLKAIRLSTGKYVIVPGYLSNYFRLQGLVILGTQNRHIER